MSLSIRTVLLSPNAVVPSKGTPGAAGYDVYSCDRHVLRPNSITRVGTGFSLEIPDEDWYGRLADRSSMAARGVTILGGVIDPDYRGMVEVLLFNLGRDDVEIRPGDRVAQLIFERKASVTFLPVDRLSSTARGSSGFGSTGR